MGGTIASPPDFVQSAPACRRAGLAAQLAPMGILRFLEPLRQEKRLAPLLVMIACIMMGSGLVAPILSLYAQTFGVAGALVGTLITVFGIGRLLANLRTERGIRLHQFFARIIRHSEGPPSAE